jgi:hypothetical protein
MNPTTQPASPPTVPRVRRWPRYLLVALALVVGLPAAAYWYLKWSAANEAESVMAETDRLDPGWRLHEIEAAREVLEPEHNSALQVIKVVGLAGRGIYHKDYDLIFEKLDSPHELNVQQLEFTRNALEKLEEALAEARKLKDMPKGRFPINYTPIFITTTMQRQQDARRAMELLKHDAYLRAHGGDLDGAVESCRALMNTARSLGDEPIMISLLIRIAGDHIALQALERTLAQGRPSEKALRPMQELIEQEIIDEQKHWLNALRGERAGQQVMVQAINDGKFKVGAFIDQSNPANRLLDYLPLVITREYPIMLRRMNEAVEIAKLPLEQQGEKLRDLQQTARSSGFLVRMLEPAMEKVAMAHLRDQTFLRAAQVAVASERFRIRHERWPQSPAELEKSGLIAKAPADPYDGAPLRFRRWPQGVAAYGVGFDRTDDGGKIDIHRAHEKGVDIGFKLWDLPRRRQAPRPRVLLDQGVPLGP